MNQENNFNTEIQHKQIKSFHQLKLSCGDYLRALEKLHFTEPTPIQILSIPEGLTEKNIIAQAKAGTGKTLAFSSIILEKLINRRQTIFQDSNPLVLIILPTRELAIQVFEFIQQLLKALNAINPNLLPYVNCGIFIGGLPLQDDRRNLKIQHVKIIIGTIGRVVALIKENSLVLSSINTLVLDEADKLMGQKDFYKHITFIFDSLNKQTLNNISVNSQQDINNNLEELKQQEQTLIQDEKESAFEVLQRRKKNLKLPVQYLAYSATYPDDLKQKMEKLMETSVFVDAIQLQNQSNSETENKENENRDLNLENIIQYRVDVKQEGNISVTKQKINILTDILKQIKFNQAIIFYNDKIKGENIFSELKAQNYSVIFIHGDQTQADRIKVMNQIRRNKTQIIISTDLLSRGIDITTIDLVINYDVPSSVETYYHRIGRTGRYGRFGISVILVQQNEENFIQQNIIHFCRLQDLPQNFSDINIKLQQKLADLNQDTHLKQSQDQILDTKEKSLSSNQKKNQKNTPQNYHHEFTQGILMKEVDVNEKFYDESTFKYFEEEECSPILLNGQTELSGSMFSDEDDMDNDDDDDNQLEDEDYSNENINIEAEQESNHTNLGANLKDEKQNKIFDKKGHICEDKSEWGFLSCSVCYDFLLESEHYLNKKFEIIKYFNVKKSKKDKID
ncbi:hypothetical protein ABPG74_005545 [Tetrahymena malaccensis]